MFYQRVAGDGQGAGLHSGAVQQPAAHPVPPQVALHDSLRGLPRVVVECQGRKSAGQRSSAQPRAAHSCGGVLFVSNVSIIFFFFCLFFWGGGGGDYGRSHFLFLLRLLLPESN